MSRKSTEPLQDLLDSVLARLEVLETKTGLVSSATSTTTSTTTTTTSNGSARATTPTAVLPSIPVLVADTKSASLNAYNALLESHVKPLAAACDALPQDTKNMGALLIDAWTSIRTILTLASRSKKPTTALATELQAHLGPTQTHIAAIRSLRLHRTLDHHCKAIVESLTCLSWILIVPPPQTPAAFVKEAVASTEYWSNKIRKEYKANTQADSPQHIAFCNALKDCLKALLDYITEYHKTGLTWNPRGVSLAEAAITMSETPPAPAEDGRMISSPVSPRRKYLNVVSGGTGGMTNLMTELSKKRTADGSSAATGLKHVNRDQQTWRKEYKGEKKSSVDVQVKEKSGEPQPQSQPVHKKKLTGLPICEYQERGHKWVVEHQTKESCGGTVLKVEVTDPKQQVYMFNCENVTVQIEGVKLKSVILDKCTKCNVVFRNVISACEMVNCKRIQVQTLGICPSFSIDKTEGCLVYLSKESMAVTAFTTCQSTEMNVSFPDGGEQKELPIPEQFVHKLEGGVVKSEVSDLYH